MERDREHENAEDDAGGVEDAQLRDQPPERDLQTELRLIDNDQRQYISCKYNCSASYVFSFILLYTDDSNTSYGR